MKKRNEAVRLHLVILLLFLLRLADGDTGEIHKPCERGEDTLEAYLGFPKVQLVSLK